MPRQQKLYGRKWWTQEWMVLLTHSDPARMERARGYAAGSRVLNLHVRGNAVTAQVRGSRIKPYSVELRFSSWPAERLRTLYPRLRLAPGWKQFLGAAELPMGWRAPFAGAGLRLIPDPDETMQFACSCPDWSWPCKHAMAVCCELSERLDAEPLLLLELQGFVRESLFEIGSEAPAQSSPLEVNRFWSSGEIPQLELPILVEAPEPMLARLGPLPGALSRQRLLQALWPVYQLAMSAGDAPEEPEYDPALDPDADKEFGPEFGPAMVRAQLFGSSADALANPGASSAASAPETQSGSLSQSPTEKPVDRAEV